MKKFTPTLANILKLLAIGLLILAISNPSVVVQSESGKLVVLLDESRSVRELGENPEEELNQTLKNIKAEVVTLPFGRTTTIAGQETTNLEEALRVALGYQPQAVVLVSDMLETSGDIRRIIPSYQQEKVLLFPLPLTSELKESLISKVEVPARVFREKPFPLKVQIYTTVPTTALLEIKLYSPRLAIYETLEIMELTLLPGVNNFLPTIKVDNELSLAQLRLTLREAADTWAANNDYLVAVPVEDAYPLLLLYGEGVDSSLLQELLSDNGFIVDSRSARKFPTTYEELANFKGVILQDVSTLELSAENVRFLDYFLRQQGRGLITIGGSQSFGLGGYKGSALEELLPVISEVLVPHQIPEVALLLVLDTSGSMATEGRFGSKLKIAKEAVRRAFQVLSPDDLFSLLAFHSKSEVLLPFDFNYSEREKEFNRLLDRQVAGGGTDIVAALKEAELAFRGVEASNKQLLIITDGLSPEAGLEEVLLKLKDQKVEVVAIGVGTDANLEFLRRLTAPWGGKVFYSPEGETLPEIASREVGRIKASYLYLRAFSPEVATTNQLLEGINQNDLKKELLSGYLRTTARREAEVILTTPLKEPLVALSRVGLGRSLVFTADGEGKLTGRFINSPLFSTLLTGMVREVIMQEFGELEIVNNKIIYYNQTPLPLNTIIRGVLKTQDPYTEIILKFTREGIESFSADLPDLATGSYFLQVTEEGGRILQELPINVSYPREYLLTGDNFVLPWLQEQKGVEVLAGFSDLSTLEVPPGKTVWYFRWVLVALALAIFLTDLTFSMLGIKGRDIFRKIFTKKEVLSREKIKKRQRFLEIFKR